MFGFESERYVRFPINIKKVPKAYRLELANNNKNCGDVCLSYSSAAFCVSADLSSQASEVPPTEQAHL